MVTNVLAEVEEVAKSYVVSWRKCAVKYQKYLDCTQIDIKMHMKTQKGMPSFYNIENIPLLTSKRCERSKSQKVQISSSSSKMLLTKTSFTVRKLLSYVPRAYQLPLVIWKSTWEDSTWIKRKMKKKKKNNNIRIVRYIILAELNSKIEKTL